MAVPGGVYIHYTHQVIYLSLSPTLSLVLSLCMPHSGVYIIQYTHHVISLSPSFPLPLSIALSLCWSDPTTNLWILHNILTILYISTYVKFYFQRGDGGGNICFSSRNKN